MLPPNIGNEDFMPIIADHSGDEQPYFFEDGAAFFRVDLAKPLYIVATGGEENRVDTGLMAAAYVKAAFSCSQKAMDKNEFFRQLLSGKLESRSIPGLLARFGVDESRERACIVLRDNDGIEAFVDTLAQVFEPGSAETILQMDRNTVCVVLSKTSEIALQDSEEFAAAIEGTALEFGSSNLLIGIGDTRKSIMRLGESYDEACRAIDMGITYFLPGSVFVYKHMIVERLVSEIPDDLCRKSYGNLFNKRNGKLLNEEMLRTINVFMQCNLNLSEASRLLFVHRNTLVYRLDKLQAATGLDLRKFEDAATFRFVMLLGHRLGEFHSGSYE